MIHLFMAGDDMRKSRALHALWRLPTRGRLADEELAQFVNVPQQRPETDREYSEGGHDE